MRSESKNMIIKKDNIETVVQISQQIPEFVGPPPAAEYYRRLRNVPHIV